MFHVNFVKKKEFWPEKCHQCDFFAFTEKWNVEKLWRLKCEIYYTKLLLNNVCII